MLRKTMRSIPAAVLGLVLLLGGCASSDPEESADGPDDVLTDLDVSDASEEQAAEISDREVTLDEYQAAFQRYRDCLSAAGFELENVEFKNHVYESALPDAAVQDGADAECYRAEYYYVDMIWQGSDLVQNAREAEPLMQECLRERGIEPGDSATEVDEQLREAGIDMAECLS